MKMEFPEGNSIAFFQDMNYYAGVPSGVEFDAEIKQDGTTYLTAPGYGEKGNYGNGSLIIRISNYEKMEEQIKKSIGDNAYKIIETIVKNKIKKALDL